MSHMFSTSNITERSYKNNQFSYRYEINIQVNWGYIYKKKIKSILHLKNFDNQLKPYV